MSRGREAVSRPIAHRRWPATALVAVLALGLAGCRPLYVPPVPAMLPSPEVAQLGDASALSVEKGSLVLHLVLTDVPEQGWIDVQWFAPDGSQAASDSTWVTPADVGEGRTLTMPARVTLSAGEWRAVASLRGQILRQFRVEVPPEAGAPAPSPTVPSQTAPTQSAP